MNYHLFVLTITLVVYFIMKRYYSKKETDNKSSRLIYLLSVPFVMYLYKYLTKDDIHMTNVTSPIDTSTDVTSEPLLTELYPETSVNSTSSISS